MAELQTIVIRYKVYIEQHPRAGLNIQHVNNFGYLSTKAWLKVNDKQLARAGQNT